MIEVVAETGSTNADLAARLGAGEDLAEGHWLVADRQNAGKGRQGRVWSDGLGNFMGSTAARLWSGDPPAHTLSLVAGVATFAAVEAVAPGLAGLSLKWPNDLLLDNAKLAGILLERAGNTVIVGVGVNLAYAPQIPGRKVVSLAQAGCAIERDAFAAMLDTCWIHALRLWHTGAWDDLRREWIMRAHASGTPLRVHGAGEEIVQGTFAGLDPEGALQLRLGDGTTRTIHTGEVFHDGRR